MTPDVNLKATINSTGSISASLVMRTRFSHRHIHCAQLCTNKCIEIEKMYKENSKFEGNTLQYGEDQAYASGAIISSVAYLEALINEFFNDCENNVKFFNVIAQEKNDLLKRQWKKGVTCRRKEKHSAILCKYLTAFSIINGNGIDELSDKFKDVKDLIKLRNSLVHYHSFFQYTDKDPYGLNHLQGRFDENMFMKKTGNDFFPYKCLGAGCAKWAIQTSIEFTDLFHLEIKLKKMFPDHQLIENL